MTEKTEIKPVAERRKYHGNWVYMDMTMSGVVDGDEGSLYDQSAIDALRAEVDRLRGWRDHLQGVGDKLLADIERAEAECEALRGLLRMCRDEFAGLPHSLGYEFTHLPKIDAAVQERG